MSVARRRRKAFCLTQPNPQHAEPGTPRTVDGWTCISVRPSHDGALQTGGSGGREQCCPWTSIGCLERLARLATVEVHQRLKHFQACPLLQASRGSGRGTLDFGPSTRSRKPETQGFQGKVGRGGYTRAFLKTEAECCRGGRAGRLEDLRMMRRKRKGSRLSNGLNDDRQGR